MLLIKCKSCAWLSRNNFINCITINLFGWICIGVIFLELILYVIILSISSQSRQKWKDISCLRDQNFGPFKTTFYMFNLLFIQSSRLIFRSELTIDIEMELDVTISHETEILVHDINHQSLCDICANIN